jgi:prolyl-tRNA synthetase
MELLYKMNGHKKYTDREDWRDGKMPKDNKQVEQITDMEVDFAKWYTDVCKKAELIDYSSVKGLMILRPYGYAIWENIMKELDCRFKEKGHENVSMPMLIPEDRKSVV